MSKKPLAERTAYSQGFDRGNYGNAYESTDWETWSERNRFSERSEAYRKGMIVGFFSSYELDEISEEYRDEVAAIRAEVGES